MAETILICMPDANQVMRRAFFFVKTNLPSKVVARKKVEDMVGRIKLLSPVRQTTEETGVGRGRCECQTRASFSI